MKQRSQRWAEARDLIQRHGTVNQYETWLKYERTIKAVQELHEALDINTFDQQAWNFRYLEDHLNNLVSGAIGILNSMRHAETSEK